ncbi:MAG: helix-turn-helix domain-containing protein [Flavobacteriales bacterium]|jgi:transcriptional regulator with XRE-family HTH domain
MDKITLEIIGSRLKEVRENLQMNQKQVADAIGKKQGIISALEQGKNGGLETLFALLNLYKKDIHIADLWQNDFDFYYSNQKQKNINFEKDIKQQKKQMMTNKIMEVIDTYMD